MGGWGGVGGEECVYERGEREGVCMYVSVWERGANRKREGGREREREREKEIETERERDRQRKKRDRGRKSGRQTVRPLF